MASDPPPRPSTPLSLPSPPTSWPFSDPDLFPANAWVSLAFFLVIIGLFQRGSVLHCKLTRNHRPPRGADEESTRSSARPPQPWSSNHGWAATARLPLAAVNAFRVIAFRCALELGTFDIKVADVVLTLAYVGFLLAWTYVGYAKGEPTKLNVSILSGRAGLLAASQFPFVTALGTKNNVVSLVTGVGYERLNFLHRVTARSCFGLLIIHASGKLYTADSISVLLQQTWVRFAITALTSLTILMIVSLHGIRTRAYELFFYTHFVAVFIFLLAAYFHTGQTRTSYWIWPSFMFWALDRLMRFARVVVYNHLYYSFSGRARLQDAAIELLNDNFVRVRVRRPPHFQWSAGQTAYLTMPSVSTFPLEAHPFSISTVDSALFRPSAGDERAAEEDDAADWKELVFIIDVRGGFTKWLREYATQNQTTKLFIDGPYGSAPDMGAYDASIFVAGGSGITYTLPVLLNLIEAAQKGTSRCRRVVFIWAVRDKSHALWISEALYRAHALTPSWLTVSIRIFVTRGGSSGGSVGGDAVSGALPPFSEISSVDTGMSPVLTDKEGEAETEGSRERDPDRDLGLGLESALPPNVRIATGRPDLEGVLKGEVDTATGRMAVTVCGSQRLTRAVRRALRFPVSSPWSVMSGRPSVTLYVESFGYA